MTFAPDVLPTATLPQASEVGEKVMLPAVAPVPVRLASWGLPLALSFAESVPVCVPVLCGVNVIEIVQFELAATELPQLLLSVKTELDATILDTLNAVD